MELTLASFMIPTFRITGAFARLLATLAWDF